MASYRNLSLSIDAETGRLINANGDRITREEFLPRLMLVDKVRVCCEFFRIREENGMKELTVSPLPAGTMMRIIGDSDHNLTTPVMFAADGVWNAASANRIVFVISSDNLRFAEALNNQKNRKCEFVITMVEANESSFVVLAKDFFIAENRPIESVDLDPAPINPALSEQQVRALISGKSEVGHQHIVADITDFPSLEIDWNHVSEKPAVFPPATHSHGDYALTIHNHTVSDLTDWSVSVEWSDISGKPDDFPAIAHRHAASEIDNLPSTDLTNYTGSVALNATYASNVYSIFSIVDGTREINIGNSTMKTFVRGNPVEVVTGGSGVKISTTGSAATVEIVTNDLKFNNAGLNAPGGLLKLDVEGNIPSIIGGGSGAPGKSAYQSWLDQGNSGSVADFLAALKGEVGTPGLPGAPGEPGTPGAPGTVTVILSATAPTDAADGTIWIEQ